MELVTYPINLSGADFHAYAARSLASANAVSETEGMARLGDILYAMSQAAGGLLTLAYQRYRAASSAGGVFELEETKLMIGVLKSVGVCTVEEMEAVINNWPQRC
jgi:hypothetical protein